MIDRESERKLIRRETALAVPESTTWDTPLRGGSWSYYRDLARAVFRYVNYPFNRYYFIGFRVVSVVRPTPLFPFNGQRPRGFCRSVSFDQEPPIPEIPVGYALPVAAEA